MNKIGYILVAIGFLFASYFAVISQETVKWKFFIPALALGIIGVMMIRVYLHWHRTAEHKITGRLADIETSITSIAKNTSSLCSQLESIPTRRVHNKIDELFTEDIIKFVDSRQAIAQVYGLQEYADTMSYFASAERAVNRAWSASTDGYVNEVETSLQKAREHFAVVNEKLNSLKRKKEQQSEFDII